MNGELKDIYSVHEFRTHGHELVDKLADLLERSLAKSISVNNYKEPEERIKEWKAILDKKDLPLFYNRLIEESIHLHHPHYIGHQISPPAPLSALSGLAADFLNNGMGVYEMGGPSTALERLVIQTIGAEMGFEENADGFLTSGGTLANLTALLTARSKINGENIWSEGYKNNKYAIMVSSQAHYCVDRAARIMGLGDEGIIKIPVNNLFQMNTSLLDQYYTEAKQKGIQVFAVVGSACSTSTGSYDDLKTIANFAYEKGVWFHIDGAHGGAAAFSEKYRYLLNGIDHADSVIVDCHKMMMTPALATAIIYKNGQNSYATFAQHAQYLFDKEEQEWHNLAKRTFECTKFMMSVKFSTILLMHGSKGIGNFVTKLYDLGQVFAHLIRERSSFELGHYPESNIVCYRLKGKNQSVENVEQLNYRVRQRLLKEGRFYIVQTRLNNQLYLRSTIMNPFTTREDLNELLDYLENIALEKDNYAT